MMEKAQGRRAWIDCARGIAALRQLEKLPDDFKGS